MTKEKNWYQSTTINAAIVILALPLFNHFGIKTTQQDLQAVFDQIQNISTSLGALMVIWGRYKSETKIKLPFTPKDK